MSIDRTTRLDELVRKAVLCARDLALALRDQRGWMPRRLRHPKLSSLTGGMPTVSHLEGSPLIDWTSLFGEVGEERSRIAFGDMATLHYELDDVSRQAYGVIVFDTSGRSYTHKFFKP